MRHGFVNNRRSRLPPNAGHDFRSHLLGIAAIRHFSFLWKIPDLKNLIILRSRLWHTLPELAAKLGAEARFKITHLEPTNLHVPYQPANRSTCSIDHIPFHFIWPRTCRTACLRATRSYLSSRLASLKNRHTSKGFCLFTNLFPKPHRLLASTHLNPYTSFSQVFILPSLRLGVLQHFYFL